MSPSKNRKAVIPTGTDAAATATVGSAAAASTSTTQRPKYLASRQRKRTQPPPDGPTSSTTLPLPLPPRKIPKNQHCHSEVVASAVLSTTTTNHNNKQTQGTDVVVKHERVKTELQLEEESLRTQILEFRKKKRLQMVPEAINEGEAPAANVDVDSNMNPQIMPPATEGHIGQTVLDDERQVKTARIRLRCQTQCEDRGKVALDSMTESQLQFRRYELDSAIKVKELEIESIERQVVLEQEKRKTEQEKQKTVQVQEEEKRKTILLEGEEKRKTTLATMEAKMKIKKQDKTSAD